MVALPITATAAEHGPLANKRDRHRAGAHAVARDAAGGGGDVEDLRSQEETTVMTPARFITMAAFTDEIKDLVQHGFDRRDVHRFLAETRIEHASLAQHVSFEDGRYTRHLVHKSSEVELLVLCWPRGSRAPVHGHEGELCWARVERGRLRFTNYRETSRVPLHVLPVGGALEGGPGYLDGPADLHAVENPKEFDADAVSLHIYSRPYDECDIYDLAAGLVRRVRLRYDSVPQGWTPT